MDRDFGVGVGGGVREEGSPDGETHRKAGDGSGGVGRPDGHHQRPDPEGGQSPLLESAEGYAAEQIPAIQGRVLQQAVDNLVVRQLVRAEMERSGVLISHEEIEKGKQDLEKAMGPGDSLAMLMAEANLPMEELEMQPPAGLVQEQDDQGQAGGGAGAR